MQASNIRPKAKLIRENRRAVKELYPHVTNSQLLVLRELSATLGLSVRNGDLLLLDARWYVTHSGLLRVAQRRRCSSITTELAEFVSNPNAGRWVFKATVVKSGTDRFVGYGDADPSNVSFLVHGAEMRIAETRAVNRALRKAYGIGICSVEELGSITESNQAYPEPKKLPPQPTNGTRRSYGSRPPLPRHSPASTRSQPRQGLCDRFLRRQGSSRCHARTSGRPSSCTWRTGPRRTAMPCSASSTATPSRRKVPHETPDHRPPCRRSLCCRPGA